MLHFAWSGGMTIKIGASTTPRFRLLGTRTQLPWARTSTVLAPRGESTSLVARSYRVKFVFAPLGVLAALQVTTTALLQS